MGPLRGSIIVYILTALITNHFVNKYYHRNNIKKCISHQDSLPRVWARFGFKMLYAAEFAG